MKKYIIEGNEILLKSSGDIIFNIVLLKKLNGEIIAEELYETLNDYIKSQPSGRENKWLLEARFNAFGNLIKEYLQSTVDNYW